MSDTKKILTLIAMIALPLPGCEDAPTATTSTPEEGPAEELPPDVLEEGWDDISGEARRDLLRTELDDTIAQLRDATEPRSELRRHAVRLLSALRPELASTPAGWAEYRALEREVESLTGDE